MNTRIVNLNAVQNAPLHKQPFPFMVISNFLNADLAHQVWRDFPPLKSGGSIPPDGLASGPAFQELIRELEGDELRQTIQERFDLNLENRPVFITLRGKTRAKDGRIHSDTKSKLITLLLYLNPEWNSDGGKLRVLRSPDNLEDYVEEIPPLLGTCLIFKVTENCWHGHKPFVGDRLAIQLNYLESEAALRQHRSRHKTTAFLKGLKNLFSSGEKRE